MRAPYFRRSHYPFLTLAVLLSIASRAFAEKPKFDWEPAKTRVFVVGLLEWQHPEIWSSFPAAMKDRRDQQLVDLCRSAGIPDEQIVYLKDAVATRNRIEKEFTTFLDNTEEGDLLVFYFCGHGYRDTTTGQTWFANYDAGRRDRSAWNVRSILSTIEQHFSGDRVLLLADCCHSGALYDEARRHRNSKIKYAALTSSYCHNSSTGHWTFSDSVLAGLRGSGEVDFNRDNLITLDEIARYTELELAFIEGQKSMFFAPEKFPQKMAIAAVETPANERLGQRLEVNWKGQWYKAKTIDADGERLKIHYTNFDNSWDEWVGRDRIRAYQFPQFAVGAKVDVQWSTDRKWYPATVQQSWYGLNFIRYDGYDATWDEWVGPNSIRPRSW